MLLGEGQASVVDWGGGMSVSCTTSAKCVYKSHIYLKPVTSVKVVLIIKVARFMESDQYRLHR